jgi:hypothetical protein
VVGQFEESVYKSAYCLVSLITLDN